jgi:hypothetical protein
LKKKLFFRLTVFTLIASALLCSSIVPTNAQSSENFDLPKKGDILYANYNSLFMPWTLKEDIVPQWIEFADAHNGTYESIGKSSFLGNWDIVAFKFGNSSKPVVMINSFLHGNEQYGYEALWSLANWMLSNDTVAKNILENNYVVLIPVVDYRWARTNYNYQSGADAYVDVDDNKPSGVDLNRNFSPSWTNASNDQQYSGVAPDSEMESQALIAAWTKYQPRFYWTLNQGSTRVYNEAIGTTNQQLTDLKNLKAILPAVARDVNTSGSLVNITIQSVYGNCYGGNGKGYAIDGASSHGAAGIISELKPGWSNIDEIKADLDSGETFKQVKTIFIAMTQALIPQEEAIYQLPPTDAGNNQGQNSQQGTDPSTYPYSPIDSSNPDATPVESRSGASFVPGDIEWIIFVIIIAAVACVGLAVNFKKRKG